MKNRYEMRFSGSGGQGVILASVIFAEAAIISGINAVQSQSYGPEARGGMCKAETIISRDSIDFSKPICPGFLLALTQKALDKFLPETRENAVIVADASLNIPENAENKKLVLLPILKTAGEDIGKAFTANIVAVGAINRLLGLFDRETLTEAVKRHVPPGSEALNEKALQAGYELVDRQMAESCRVYIV